MTLRELMNALEKALGEGADLTSPVIVEGHDEDDNFIQASLGDVKVESRCEGDDEPIGVYIALEEIEVG